VGLYLCCRQCVRRVNRENFIFTSFSEIFGAFLLKSCKSAPIGFLMCVCFFTYPPPHVSNWELAVGEIYYNFPETSDNTEGNNRQSLLRCGSYLESEGGVRYFIFCLTFKTKSKHTLLSKTLLGMSDGF
jgi:hypothetical protein